MNDKIIDSLASHVVAHWKSMDQEPKYGKMILVKYANDPYSEMFKYYTTTIGYGGKGNLSGDSHLDNINCVPIDINKYKFSIGYVDKPTKSEKQLLSSNRIFVAKDGMYEETKNFIPKRAPFTALHFEKWIYLEEILGL